MTILAPPDRLLWVVEDVHWADRSTREMITYLLSHPPTNRATLILTYRLDDLHRRHPLRPVLAEWGRLPGVERITVPPLDESDVRGMVRALQRSPLREDDVATIVSRAEGNPFFVEELVGADNRRDRPLPADLSDLLLIRIDSLGDDSPPGGEGGVGGWPRGLAPTARHGGGRRRHQLSRPACAPPSTPRSSWPPTETAYAFRHALLSEAVYGDLLPGSGYACTPPTPRAMADDPTSGTAADLARHARGAHDPITAAKASVWAGDAGEHAGRAR